MQHPQTEGKTDVGIDDPIHAHPHHTQLHTCTSSQEGRRRGQDCVVADEVSLCPARCHSTSDPASCYYAPWEAQVLEPHPLIWKAQFKVLAVGLSLAVSVVGF